MEHRKFKKSIGRNFRKKKKKKKKEENIVKKVLF